uniref:DDB1- and CUL4-associated factor 13 n=1 Tax=Panagrolaimus sp. JU765 TaxID=591449 RepID=A0AC34RED0_9BILA
MKVKVISRNPDHYQRETKLDLFKVPQFIRDKEDPLQPAVEYTRALNAAKLNRLFAKPFLASFEGHNDAVNVLAKHPLRLNCALSGGRDGQVRVWNLSLRKCSSYVQAHNGPVLGVSVNSSTGDNFATVGMDSQIKFWRLSEFSDGDLGDPIHSVAMDYVPTSINYMYESSDFVTGGQGLSFWKALCDSPFRTYNIGESTVQAVKCNPVETTVFAGCCEDRSIFIFDSREKVPVQKVVMKLRTNNISWNPREPFTFVAANDDYNLYTFDMRSLLSARKVHYGHVGAVLDVDYSPTGREFVSGSIDKSIRIWESNAPTSREIYTVQRMQYVLSVLYTLDNKYILSGSNEFNVRLWKANASEKLGALVPREKAAMDYSNQLRNQYSAHPKVGAILKRRKVPRQIKNLKDEHQIIREKQDRKFANIQAHTKHKIIEKIPNKVANIIESWDKPPLDPEDSKEEEKDGESKDAKTKGISDSKYLKKAAEIDSKEKEKNGESKYAKTKGISDSKYLKKATEKQNVKKFSFDSEAVETFTDRKEKNGKFWRGNKQASFGSGGESFKGKIKKEKRYN